MAGATVIAYHLSTARVFKSEPTDSKGHYEMSELPLGYFDLAVGICLICGLFARWAALAGAGFLFSICLSQWPWAPDAIPATYQFIEMLGMLVIAAVGVGQFAGADFFIAKLWKSCCPPKEGASS